jgi:RNA polymerase-binding protein DksA
VAKKVTKKRAVAAKSGSPQPAPKKAVKKAGERIKNVPKTAAKTPKKKPARKTSSVPTNTKQLNPTPTELKTTLTKAELGHFRTLLVAKLKEITGDVDHIEKESLRMSRQDATGDLSSMPIHMADIGSDNYEQEFTLGLMNTERKIVHEILMALRRIDEGTFGMCEGTGESIPMTRLEAYPWARYCVRYAEMIEKGQVVEVRNNSYSSGNYASVVGVADTEDEEDDEEIDQDDDETPDEDDDVVDFDDDDDDEYDDEPYYN